ncbi:MAG: hypothetical protein WEB00_07110 [Dehalococcoidia bacterium]
MDEHGGVLTVKINVLFLGAGGIVAAAVIALTRLGGETAAHEDEFTTPSFLGQESLSVCVESLAEQDSSALLDAVTKAIEQKRQSDWEGTYLAATPIDIVEGCPIKPPSSDVDEPDVVQAASSRFSIYVFLVDDAEASRLKLDGDYIPLRARESWNEDGSDDYSFASYVVYVRLKQLDEQALLGDAIGAAWGRPPESPADSLCDSGTLKGTELIHCLSEEELEGMEPQIDPSAPSR